LAVAVLVELLCLLCHLKVQVAVSLRLVRLAAVGVLVGTAIVCKHLRVAVAAAVAVDKEHRKPTITQVQQVCSHRCKVSLVAMVITVITVAAVAVVEQLLLV
jgi:hypothetical protein